jgi:hypothetical protein
MPIPPPPNTITQLEEAKRRLEDDSRLRITAKAKMGKEREKTAFTPDFVKSSKLLASSRGSFPSEPHEESRKSNRRSPGWLTSTSDSEFTVVGYYLCGDNVPYRTKLPGKNITLRQFKALITKKGNYRYFFKKACDDFKTGVVNEEITDENEILPLWDGKILAQVEAVD